MQTFAAHFRFGPTSGEAWGKYIQWSGLRHISELVSTDTMLCPPVIDELVDADWQHNIHADNKIYRFHDCAYLKKRINYDSARHNILAIIERPVSPTVAEGGFQFCGYDILDSYDSISVLTNCGGFPDIFAASEINRFGLLDDLVRANKIAATLRDKHQADPHCCDCRVWSLCRYIGPVQ
jgi:hypothetical protein